MSNPGSGQWSRHIAVVDASASVSTSLSSALHARRWTIQSFTRVQVTRRFRQWSTLQSALLLSPKYVDGQRSVRSSHKSSQGSAPYCVVLRGRSFYTRSAPFRSFAGALDQHRSVRSGNTPQVSPSRSRHLGTGTQCSSALPAATSCYQLYKGTISFTSRPSVLRLTIGPTAAASVHRTSSSRKERCSRPLSFQFFGQHNNHLLLLRQPNWYRKHDNRI